MMRSFFFVLVLVTGMTSTVAADPWLEDFEAATKAASTSGKPILVNVTASDWAAPCQKMEAEVFSRSDFLKAAQEKYVLLRLDFPRQKTQPEKIRAQNEQLAGLYSFSGFPTFLMLDAGGFLFGQKTGYVAGGVAAFLAMAANLETQKQNLFTLADAVKNAADGTERAKAEDALFRQAETWGLTSQYGDLPAKIVAEDADGEAGLKPRYQVYNAYNLLLGTWSDLDDFHLAVIKLNDLVEKSAAWPDLQQKIYFTKGMIWMNALRDELQAKEAFRQARSLGKDTETGLRASELLDQLP